MNQHVYTWHGIDDLPFSQYLMQLQESGSTILAVIATEYMTLVEPDGTLRQYLTKASIIVYTKS